ncbi:hypothetical protein SAMN05892877_1324 [Rhizobium subbaraonis]|uniref:Uncharacterized protein n=1 Tax=Rhizobium subbaraonis TaxID=908946 RepID=A0A285V0Q5_9HYPH|nr:hypothetical protein [Rhizobium subbaraonis]SOC47640.1 hypothetical protein SAMN05892877_1324 [Rhizobium subbaraonis]
MPQKSKPLPPLPADAPRAPDKPRYKEQYGVILVCPDEAAQKVLFEALAALKACKIKVVVT